MAARKKPAPLPAQHRSSRQPRKPAGARDEAASAGEDAQGAARKPYHHGALPEALLQAAETVLQRDGLPGLTLRAIAREAGVSHTAPKHHFGDTAGVLSELAATGYWRLAMEMAAQARMLPAGRERRRAIAQGYVHFAARDPGLFRLMARPELLDAKRPALLHAQRVAVKALMGIFDEAQNEQAGLFAAASPEQAIAVCAAWAYVHGLSLLLLDGQLEGIARGAGFTDAVWLIEATLDHVEPIADKGHRVKPRTP
jgi:AcrR family transcriptional regulator